MVFDLETARKLLVIYNYLLDGEYSEGLEVDLIAVAPYNPPEQKAFLSLIKSKVSPPVALKEAGYDKTKVNVLVIALKDGEIYKMDLDDYLELKKIPRIYNDKGILPPIN